MLSSPLVEGLGSDGVLVDVGEPDTSSLEPPPMTPPSHPAIHLPEVLMAIFQFLAAKDCARCARVCYAWSEAALDQIWANLQTPRHLLALAGNLTSTTAGWVYEEPYLLDAGWSSFSKIAPHVRSLVVDPTLDFEDLGLHSDVAAKLLHRLVLGERRQLIPGLRHLMWNVRQVEDIRAVGPLVPPSLEHLDLVLHPGQGERERSSLIKSIGSMTPRLQYLRVAASGGGTPEVQGALASTLHQLKNLSSLELPNIEASKEILDALATCPKIVALELKSLAEETAVPTFVEHMVTSCPSLESVILHLPCTTNTPPESSLPFHALSSLLGCTEIRSLRVLHPRLILMLHADVEGVKKAWPKLQTLHLCGGMSGVYPFGATLDVLKYIAIVFGPNLVEFGQYFATRDPPEDEEPRGRFLKLRTLDVGHTRIREQEVVGIANLLGVICPSRVDIKYSARTATSGRNWGTVKSMVKVVHRAEERGHRRGVQEGRQDRETRA